MRFRSPTRKFIGFFSKSSSPTERRYSANKKELLAIVKALHHFRYYLFGNPFIIITDHASLKYMNEQKYLNPALANWSDIIFSFTFKVVHCPGKTNYLPDLLSRVAIPLPSSTTSSCAASVENSIADDSESAVVEEFPSDNNFHVPPLSNEDSDTQSSNSVPTNLEPVPDHATRLEILQNLHSFGHFGAGIYRSSLTIKESYGPL